MDPATLAALTQGAGEIATGLKAPPSGASSSGGAISEGDVFNFGAAPPSDAGIQISRTAALGIAALGVVVLLKLE